MIKKFFYSLIFNCFLFFSIAKAQKLSGLERVNDAFVISDIKNNNCITSLESNSILSIEKAGIDVRADSSEVFLIFTVSTSNMNYNSEDVFVSVSLMLHEPVYLPRNYINTTALTWYETRSRLSSSILLCNNVTQLADDLLNEFLADWLKDN